MVICHGYMGIMGIDFTILGVSLLRNKPHNRNEQKGLHEIYRVGYNTNNFWGLFENGFLQIKDCVDPIILTPQKPWWM